jgi:hypothetical protein
MAGPGCAAGSEPRAGAAGQVCPAISFFDSAVPGPVEPLAGVGPGSSSAAALGPEAELQQRADAQVGAWGRAGACVGRHGDLRGRLLLLLYCYCYYYCCYGVVLTGLVTGLLLHVGMVRKAESRSAGSQAQGPAPAGGPPAGCAACVGTGAAEGARGGGPARCGWAAVIQRGRGA